MDKTSLKPLGRSRGKLGKAENLHYEPAVSDSAESPPLMLKIARIQSTPELQRPLRKRGTKSPASMPFHAATQPNI